MSGLLLFVMLALASYRVTHLVVLDTFPPVLALRNRIVGEDECKLQGTRIEWLGELLTCGWCASVWLSAGLVLVTQMVTGAVSYPILAWPACASVAALIIHWELKE